YAGVNGALRRALTRSVLACGCAPLRLARPPLTPAPRVACFVRAIGAKVTSGPVILAPVAGKAEGRAQRTPATIEGNAIPIACGRHDDGR
ncbi:TPA: hypothetical protein ACSPNS_004629, partial [Pseudomonas aeruginosa]